jgi:hypothetical protein
MEAKEEGNPNGPDNQVLEQPVNPQPLELQQIDEQERLVQVSIAKHPQHPQQERLVGDAAESA